MRDINTCRTVLVSFLVLISGAAAFAGCKNIVEADGSYSGVLYVFDRDLNETGTIQLNHPPGAMQVMPGCILVATREGYLLKYDSESLDLIGEYQVGPAAPDGYSEMIARTGSNHVYLIGAYGNILQIRVSDCSVQDVFSVCQLPCHLTEGGSGSNFFYVANGTTTEVIRVKLSGNTASGIISLGESVRSMARHATDSIMISTEQQTRLLHEASPGQLVAGTMFFGAAKCLGYVPGASYSVAVFEAYVCIIYPDEGLYWVSDNICYLKGSPRLLASEDPQRAFVLSSLEDHTSLVTGYEHTSGYVFDEVELQGIPMGIQQSSSSGSVFVLTAVE